MSTACLHRTLNSWCSSWAAFLLLFLFQTQLTTQAFIYQESWLDSPRKISSLPHTIVLGHPQDAKNVKSLQFGVGKNTLFLTDHGEARPSFCCNSNSTETMKDNLIYKYTDLYMYTHTYMYFKVIRMSWPWDLKWVVFGRKGSTILRIRSACEGE